MNIAVITITCRPDPRLEEMGKTLEASARRCNKAKVGWIIVDELASARTDATIQTLMEINDRRVLGVQVVPPMPSEHREGPAKRPAHNSARNAGLRAAVGADYVVFLNDCALVTADFVSVANELGQMGKGWRVRSMLEHEVRVKPDPNSGELRFRDRADLFRPVLVTTVAGTCWGAPMAAFQAIGGFDLAYDGEDKNHDADAAIRLGRAGIAFVTTQRAIAVSLRRTKNRDDISTDRASFVGVRNQALLRRLGTEPTRIHPLEGVSLAPSGVPAVAVVAPEATNAEPIGIPIGEPGDGQPAPDVVVTSGVIRRSAVRSPPVIVTNNRAVVAAPPEAPTKSNKSVTDAAQPEAPTAVTDAAAPEAAPDGVMVPDETDEEIDDLFDDGDLGDLGDLSSS